MGQCFSHGRRCCADFDLFDRELRDEYTACNASFPSFENIDKQAICFNVQPGDVLQQPDPYFQWQGTYFQLAKDGVPMHPSWRDGLKINAKEEGVELVKKFCQTKLIDGEDIYYSPAKAKRWGVPGPDPEKPTSMENLLVKRQQKWIHIEVSADDKGEVTGKEFPIVEDLLLKRITYLFFSCNAKLAYNMPGGVYENDPSEAAWLWGSSLIRPCFPQAQPDFPQRFVESIPKLFESVRFVPLSSRAAFVRKIASTPTAVITGATLEKGSNFASKFSSEIGFRIGTYLGQHADKTGVKVMVNGSMRGHERTMSADDDFSAGFESQCNCKAVSVKGLNLVHLHGNAWKVKSGTAYVLEEELNDFSNNAKEACVCAGALNPKSIVMAANGGPTVSQNLSRFLHLSSAKRVFAINGMHNQGGMSGASGSFQVTAESLDKAVGELKKLSPEVFTDVEAGEALQDELAGKPLTLLNLSVDGDGHCVKDFYTLKAGEKNTKASPGIVDEQHVHNYCKDAVSIMVEQVCDVPAPA